MKRKEVIQHYVQTLFTPTCVPLALEMKGRYELYGQELKIKNYIGLA